MKSKIILAALAVTIAFLSCKKSTTTVTTNNPPTPTIVGMWKGKYSNSSTTYPTSGYAFLFRADGTVRVFNNQDTSLSTTAKAEGTYLKSGTAVTTTYTYIAPGSGTYSTAATIDANMTFIEGTWGSGTNTTNGGLYFIVKQ